MRSQRKIVKKSKTDTYRSGLNLSLGKSQNSNHENSEQIQRFLEMCNSNYFQMENEDKMSNKAPSLAVSDSKKISFRERSLNSSNK